MFFLSSLLHRIMRTPLLSPLPKPSSPLSSPPSSPPLPLPHLLLHCPLPHFSFHSFSSPLVPLSPPIHHTRSHSTYLLPFCHSPLPSAISLPLHLPPYCTSLSAILSLLPISAILFLLLPPTATLWPLLHITSNSSQPPQTLPCLLPPLCKVAGTEGLVHIHIPFSITDLSQISHHVGSFDANLHNYIEELKFVIQSYDLTYKDLCVILTSTLSPKQKAELWQAAQAVTDEKTSDKC